MAKRKPTTKAGKERKISRVIREFDRGELRKGPGKSPKVTKRKQAIAIALSEAGVKRKKPKKRK